MWLTLFGILLDMISKEIFFIIVIASSANGLYEDQIGIFDWKQSYIGHVSHASYDATPDSSGNRAIFVAAADTGVFGALSAKDGNVIWRHFLSQGERISTASIYGDCLLIVSGNVARCFYSEGILKTQLILPISESETTKFSRTNADSILFATDKNICLLKGNNYKCLPIPSLPSGNLFFVGCIDPTSTCIISQESSGLVSIYQALLETTAKIVKLSSGLMNDQIIQCESFFNGLSFACLLDNGKIWGPVNFRDFSTGISGFVNPQTCAQAADLHGSKATHLKIINDNYFIEFEDGSKILCKAETKTRRSFDKDSIVIDAVSADHNGKETTFALLNEGGSNYRLVLIDEAGNQLADSTFSSQVLLNEGSDAIFPIVLKKRGANSGDNAPILRALIRTKYDSLLFIQGGAVKWTRDEGLGQSQSAIFFDLPLPGYLADIASEVISKNSNIFLSFARRVRFESDILFSTVFDLIDTFSHGGFGALLHLHKDTKHSLLHHHINRHTGDGRDVAVELHRDKFGLEKLILILTMPGKVYAIHSLTGVVVWDLLMGDCRPLSIYQLRGTDNTAMESIVVVVGQNTSSNGQVCLIAFDGLTGSVQESSTLSFLPGIFRPYVHADPNTHITPLLFMIPNRSTVYVYPPKLTDFVLQSSKNVYFHLISEKVVNNAEVTGYFITPSKNPSDHLALSKTWSVKLPAGEHIVTVAERRPDERVHSKAVVLSDRTVLYRYLNPNIIFIVTSTIPSDRKDTDKDIISVYLVDAVSGRFFYQGQHRHARGPIFAVNCENFVSYSYWNSQMRRTEVSVIELFEGKIERNGTVFSSFDNYGSEVPLVMKQGYVLNDMIRSMAVTTTRRGITHRSVLLGLASGRILEVPKMLLNPRRLLSHTPELAEEGIPPYVPEIIMHPESYINYNRTLDRIAHLYTASSGLESTCLLFSSGLDLYFARVWPSKMFDMLKEDFDYAFIIMITVGLLAATFVFRYLVQMKELKKAWQ